MTAQTYEAWRISYQSSEQAARAAFARVVELEADLQLANQSSGAEAYEIACEEMQAFQKKRDEAGKDSGACNSLVEGMAWVYEALSSAEHHLEAIGAGGVESLRKK